jgi:hypothetical protein
MAWPQTTTAPVTKAPAWRYRPYDPKVLPSIDSRSAADIALGDEYFDQWIGAFDPLDGPKQRYTRGMSGHGEGGAEDFPNAYKGEVVVAHFTRWESRFTGTHRSIYTIVHLQVDRVVASKTGKLTVNSTVPLFIMGGTVLKSPATDPGSSQTISYFMSKSDFPLEPNTEYLIFLSYEGRLKIFQYIKAWRIVNNLLEPVTE